MCIIMNIHDILNIIAATNVNMSQILCLKRVKEWFINLYSVCMCYHLSIKFAGIGYNKLQPEI